MPQSATKPLHHVITVLTESKCRNTYVQKLVQKWIINWCQKLFWLLLCNLLQTQWKQSNSSNTYTTILTAICPGLPGWASTRRNIHPFTAILIIKHPLPTSSVYYLFGNLSFTLTPHIHHKVTAVNERIFTPWDTTECRLWIRKPHMAILQPSASPSDVLHLS